MAPMLCWEEAGQRREDGPVWPAGAWSAELSAQDRDLVAQDEDLGVVGCLRSGQQSEPADELAQAQVEESEPHAGDDRGLHSPRRKPQVNAMDQGFGTDRLLRQGEAGED
jgi:hypothetical protein